MAGILRSTTEPEGPHNTTEPLSARTLYHSSGRPAVNSVAECSCGCPVVPFGARVSSFYNPVGEL